MIKGFCVDYNWDKLGQPASPGLYAQADPEALVRWHLELGCDTIHTFCVALNGHAWYPSETAPENAPGSDFLGEVTSLAHKEGLRVMGYFCLGMNPYWEILHPDQHHSEISLTTYRAPLTEEYLEYFCSCVREVLTMTEIDGFMIDWIRPIRRGRWLECEQVMYRKLMGEDFPSISERFPSVHSFLPVQLFVEFERRILERAWDSIKQAVDDTRPAIIWSNQPFEGANDPIWTGHRLLQEVDWVLNEAPKTENLAWLRQQVGPHTKVMQNACGWLAMDAERIFRDVIDAGRVDGIYGFAAADPATTMPASHGGVDEASNTMYDLNIRNIETIRKLFNREAGS